MADVTEPCTTCGREKAPNELAVLIYSGELLSKEQRERCRGKCIGDDACLIIAAESAAPLRSELAAAKAELAVWRDEDAREAKYKWVSEQMTTATARIAELEGALREWVAAIGRCGCDNDEHAHYCHEARERARALISASDDLTICPQCEIGQHGKCLTEPEVGMECQCRDPSHDAALAGKHAGPKETLTRDQRAQLSIAAHRQRLKVLFDKNEARPLPDTALRVALLDADRVADELVEAVQGAPEHAGSAEAREGDCDPTAEELATYTETAMGAGSLFASIMETRAPAQAQREEPEAVHTDACSDPECRLLHSAPAQRTPTPEGTNG